MLISLNKLGKINVNEESKVIVFVVPESSDGQRADSYLGAQEPLTSRAQARHWIDEGRVCKGGKAIKASEKLRANDVLEVYPPEPEPVVLLAEDLPLDIVYQDTDLLVVNKARGMVVHPAAGHASGTLVNALLYHVPDLGGIGGEIRPGIVHRIDKDTTGLLLVAKNQKSMAALSQMIKERQVDRYYYALVEGNVKEDEGIVDEPIGRSMRDRKKMAIREDGRAAVTHYCVKERFGDFTLLECKLETGRTHQIRVHMAHLRRPVAGDPFYGRALPKWGLKGQALHAHRLRFEHPFTGEVLDFHVDCPEDMAKMITRLESRQNNP